MRRQKAGESGAKMKAARRLPGGLSGGGHQGAATRRAARGPRSRMHAAQPTPGPGLHPPARRKKRRTASNRAPRTHHWELRNGGGGGGEARGRRSPGAGPPQPVTAASIFRTHSENRGGSGETGRVGRAAGDEPPASGACANPQPIGARREDAGAGALGRRALDQGRATPAFPCPNKTRAGARAPEGPGGGVNERAGG